MKTIKKNQVVVFVIGLMLIAAGYLSFTNNSSENMMETSATVNSERIAGIGDAKLVSANIAQTNEINVNSVNTMLQDTNTLEENITNTLENQVNETVEEVEQNVVATNSDVISTDEYFTSSRLERENMYSKRVENYQNILNNTNVSESQKKSAQEEISKLNNEQNAIMIAENLIKTKGIEDLIIFINEDSINVIVKGKDCSKEEIAQIQNIITREMQADIADIHIMNKE